MTSVVHLVATSRRASTVCCERIAADLAATDRITTDPGAYTCPGARA